MTEQMKKHKNVVEIRKELKNDPFFNRLELVMRLNTGDYIASTDPDMTRKEIVLAIEKYGAVDITFEVLGKHPADKLYQYDYMTGEGCIFMHDFRHKAAIIEKGHITDFIKEEGQAYEGI